tara:strand:- start:31086 stop:31631 length:546 start_codon:yes stop_codon:yes gene_type:complete
MKKILIATPFLLVAVFGLYLFTKKEPIPNQALTERRQSIDQDKQKRMPASLPSSEKKQVQPAAPKKREVIGDKKLIMKNGKLNFTNKPSKTWLSKLEKSLGRGSPSDTKIEIKPERSLILLEGSLAKNTEQVVVVFNSENNRNSFRAMVDSQTGKVIRTWDHTINENKKTINLTPYPLQSN